MSNGVPQVTPPMGDRRPLGGGPSVPLPLQGGPAQPVQSTMPPPSWMAGPQAMTLAPPQSVGERLADRHGAAQAKTLIDQALQGLKYNAPAHEIVQFLPGLTLEDLHDIAREHGLAVNVGSGSLEQPGTIAQAMAPAAQASAEAGLAQLTSAIVTTPAPQQPPLAASSGPPAQRVTKKHHPLIEEALLRALRTNQPPPTAEQIAAAINAPLPGVQKFIREAMPRLQAQVTAERVGGNGAASTTPSNGAPASTTLATSPPQPAPMQQAFDTTLYEKAPLPVDDEIESRTVELLRGIRTLAHSGGFSFAEVEAAAALLSTLR